MPQTPLTAAALILTLGLALPAAAGQGHVLTYEEFETAVAHSDLETCPAEMQTQEASFCRVTLKDEELHVFQFSEDADQPLLAVRSYPAEGLEALLGSR
jgi:hypothetical protein